MTSMGEAWNQASGITGIDSINTEVGFALGLALALLEVLWWTCVAYVAARKISSRTVQNPPVATDAKLPQCPTNVIP